MQLFGASSLAAVALAAALLAEGAGAFSWKDGRRHNPQNLNADFHDPTISLQESSRLPNIYTVAMHELQELESEPLCHRIAARLLVNNCQLLDGKDDATVLTDSGRQVRDFVDSYAASLAICDLERGSFAIPYPCSKFREHALASIPVSDEARLHVSTREIDTCLASLGKSDSAWNTWISYRHKALRFCEAARADNDKAQSIRLHQKLTEVLSRLTQGVEAELEEYLKSVGSKMSDTLGRLSNFDAEIQHLRNGVGELEQVIAGDLLERLRDAGETTARGLDDARSLQHLIGLLLQSVIENNAAVSASHKHAVQVMTQKTEQDMSTVMSALTAIVASTTSLQDEMIRFHSQSSSLAHRQDNLEQGLGRLMVAADDLAVRLERHTDTLGHAQERSGDLLETLEQASVSATAVKGSMSQQSGWSSWWPYIICPSASLVMGSYGLPPSAFRNLALIALGELAGMAVSASRHLPSTFLATYRAHFPTHETYSNDSLSFSSWVDETSSVALSDLRRRKIAI